ncbi:MAG TPA: response regulator transcription factor [Clostridiales bacterium]|jgi:DNA-binding response OmpR family regulator|nr:response regulator transcription factor [Clostridiales bacterium]
MSEKPKKILILEDEAAISEFIDINLKRAGYITKIASTGEEALAILAEEPDFSIALLDIMLPGIDGFEVCRQIRQSGSKMGIIMLTARAQEMDKVTGLMIGADDYVPKPFSPTELLARVDALARRIGVLSGEGNFSSNSNIIVSGRFALDLRSRTLTKDGVPVSLTQVEYLIMKYFFENRNKAISREEMLSAVWGEDYFGEAKIIDVNLRRIRKKIEDDPASPQHLVAVWGYGYKWVD